MSAVGFSAPWVKPEVIEEKAAETRGRAEWSGIPVDPFAIANRLGIKILVGSFDDDAVEGVLRVREGRPQILVRIASSLSRQKFTVAHELGHRVLHLPSSGGLCEDGELFVDNGLQFYRRGASSDANSAEHRQEVQANMFAAALLMPADAVRERAKVTRSARLMAKDFGVSEIAMQYRINVLNVW